VGTRAGGAPAKDKADTEHVKREDPEELPVPPVAVGPNHPPDLQPGIGAEIGSPADPLDKLEVFNPADLKLARILKIGDLEQRPKREELLKELAKENGWRIEAPCRDSFKAFDRLQGALKAHGIGLVIDQIAQARIKARSKIRIRTHFVLYIEDVTPDELIKILRRAALDDKKAEAKRKGDAQFEALVVNAMTGGDRAELCKLLGVRAKQLPAPSARRPDAKTPERLALAMPYNPVRPLPNSPEIKRFLDNRKPRRPGTVPVLLVLRETN